MTGWDWASFVGNPGAMKWARRDLPDLERAMFHVPQKRVAVQAGGNLGLYPKRLAADFETVYAFEPAPALFAAMMQNAPEPNIIKFQACLGDARRMCGLSQKRRDDSGRAEHEGLTHVFGDGPYPTLRIDDLALPVCDFIALDLEGWELYAVRGAVETIARCRPVLSVEVNKNQRFVGIQPEFLRDCIKGLGYRLVERIHSDDVFVPAEWPEEAACA